MYNKITIIGHAGKDAELKQISEKSNVVNFNIAVDASYKDKEGKKVETTEWVECEAWQMPFLQEGVKKGKLFLVEGRAFAKAYTPKDGGEPKAVLCLNVELVRYLSPKE